MSAIEAPCLNRRSAVSETTSVTISIKISATRPLNSINVNLQYLVPSEETPVYYASEGGRQAGLHMAGQFEQRNVQLANAREVKDSRFSLDREGFFLLEQPTKVENLYNEQSIKEDYLPEVEALIKKETGARRVVAFDHTLRGESPDTRDHQQSREPSTVVHNDYTARSGRVRLRDILGNDLADSMQHQRFSIVNFWRPIHHPVYSAPLAVCDAQTVSATDLVAVERRAKERIGELLLATYNETHQWYYFKEMSPAEALLIKTFDSDDVNYASSCIHTAVDIPAPPGKPPRESIEVRTFVIY